MTNTTDQMAPPKPFENNPPNQYNEFEEYQDDEEEPRLVPHTEGVVDSQGKLLNQQPAFDRLLDAATDNANRRHTTENAIPLNRSTSLNRKAPPLNWKSPPLNRSVINASANQRATPLSQWNGRSNTTRRSSHQAVSAPTPKQSGKQSGKKRRRNNKAASPSLNHKASPMVKASANQHANHTPLSRLSGHSNTTPSSHQAVSAPTPKQSGKKRRRNNRSPQEQSLDSALTTGRARKRPRPRRSGTPKNLDHCFAAAQPPMASAGRSKQKDHAASLVLPAVQAKAAFDLLKSRGCDVGGTTATMEGGCDQVGPELRIDTTAPPTEPPTAAPTEALTIEPTSSPTDATTASPTVGFDPITSAPVPVGVSPVIAFYSAQAAPIAGAPWEPMRQAMETLSDRLQQNNELKVQANALQQEANTRQYNNQKKVISKECMSGINRFAAEMMFLRCLDGCLQFFLPTYLNSGLHMASSPQEFGSVLPKIICQHVCKHHLWDFTTVQSLNWTTSLYSFSWKVVSWKAVIDLLLAAAGSEEMAMEYLDVICCSVQWSFTLLLLWGLHKGLSLSNQPEIFHHGLNVCFASYSLVSIESVQDLVFQGSAILSISFPLMMQIHGATEENLNELLSFVQYVRNLSQVTYVLGILLWCFAKMGEGPSEFGPLKQSHDVPIGYLFGCCCFFFIFTLVAYKKKIGVVHGVLVGLFFSFGR